MAERSKAPVLKTGRRASASWVRIPPHPPILWIKPLNLLSYLAKDALLSTPVPTISALRSPEYAASACLPNGGRQDRGNATRAEQQARVRRCVVGYFPEVTGVVVAYRASRLVAWTALPDRPPSRASAVLRVNAPLREGGGGGSPQGPWVPPGAYRAPASFRQPVWAPPPGGHRYQGVWPIQRKTKRAPLAHESRSASALQLAGRDTMKSQYVEAIGYRMSRVRASATPCTIEEERQWDCIFWLPDRLQETARNA